MLIYTRKVIFLKCQILMFFFFFWNVKKRKSRSHGKGKNGNIKRNICTEKLINTSRKDLSITLNNHGRHGLLSFFSSLPIWVLRNLELETYQLYDRANTLYKAARLTRCYVQHFLSPDIDSEVNHKRNFIKIPFTTVLPGLTWPPNFAVYSFMVISIEKENTKMKCLFLTDVWSFI